MVFADYLNEEDSLQMDHLAYLQEAYCIVDSLLKIGYQSTSEDTTKISTHANVEYSVKSSITK